MGGLAKGLSIQLQKMLQLDAENVLENICWPNGPYCKFVIQVTMR